MVKKLYQKKLLLEFKQRTLTVITDPASATCTLTYKGRSYSTKSLKVKEGDTVSYSVYHSTYGTTSGTIVMDTDKTLRCTGDNGREYYKYVNGTWSTPNLTSNTSYGTITAPKDTVYQVFNGGTLVIPFSSGKDDNSTYNIEWSFPYTVTFNSVKYTPSYVVNSYFAIKKFRLDVWQNGSYTNVYSKTDISNSQTAAITGSFTGISTTKIRLRLSAVYVATCNSRVRDIVFYGQVRNVPQRSTQYDYDYYVDTYNYTWKKSITG